MFLKFAQFYISLQNTISKNTKTSPIIQIIVNGLNSQAKVIWKITIT